MPSWSLQRTLRARRNRRLYVYGFCRRFPLDLSNTSVQTLGNTSSTADQTVFGEALTSIVLPDTLDAIGNAAFKAGTSLTSISIPSSVTRIGKNAFYQVSTLTQVVFLPYEGEGIAPQLTLEDNRSSNIPTENQGRVRRNGTSHRLKFPPVWCLSELFPFKKTNTLLPHEKEHQKDANAYEGEGRAGGQPPKLALPESVLNLGWARIRG